MKMPVVWLALACLALVVLGWPRAVEPHGSDQELVVLCPYGPLVEQVEKVARAFAEEYPGWRVRVIPAPGRDYYTKSLSMLAARQKVDLLWLGLGFAMFSDRGALLSVDELAAKDADFDIGGFLPEAVDLYRTNGELYGLPYAIDAQFYAINPSVLNREGIPLPGEDWTLEEFVEIGRRATKQGIGTQRVYGLGMAEVASSLWGLQMVSGDGRTFGLSGPEGADWLAVNVKLADEGVLLRSAATGQFDRMSEFIAGRVGIMTVYTWDLPELHLRMAGRYRLLPLPRNSAGNERTWASSQGFSIVERTKHPEMAWQLLKRLTSVELQRALPRNYIPTNRLAFEEYMESAPPEDRVIPSVLKRIAPDPRIRSWEKVDSEWRYWQDKAFEHQLTPDEVIRISTQRINAILKGEGKEES